jgi:hypothetical protein
MKKQFLILCALAAMLLPGMTKAQSTDDLLNLLINKNLIGQEEADSIRAEYAIKQQDTKEKQKLFGINSRRILQISGYTQVRFQSFQEAGKVDYLDVRRARLDFRGQISPTWDYRLQVDFATAPKILDAIITFKPYDCLKLQAGQFKLPFSQDNLTQSNLLEFIDRSQVTEALVARNKDLLGNNNGRDMGLQVFGSVLKIKERFAVDYFIGAFNGQGINTPDFNEAKDIVGRLVFHPIDGLDIGGSTYIGYDKFGIPDPKNQVRNRYGGELVYTWKNLIIRGEYIEGQDGAINKNGYFAQATYFVFPKKLQILAKYDTYDPDKIKDKNISTYYVGGLNYYFNDWAKLMFNYSYRTEQGTKVNNDLISVQAQIGF